jgi:HEAT repeat protein
MSAKLKDSSQCPTGVVARVEKLRADAASSPDQLIDRLGKALGDRSPRLREEALTLARERNLMQFEPQALSALSDKNQFVKYAAIQYLGELHEAEGLNALWLYPLLQDSNGLVRIDAMEALDQIEDRASLPRIAKLLDDDDELVRAYAAMTLGNLGAKRYRNAVERAAARETTSYICAHFSRALYSLGDSTQFDRLVEYLKADRYLARCAAANSLAALPLTRQELRAAIEAVASARVNFLHRADESTMAEVERELREELRLDPA